MLPLTLALVVVAVLGLSFTQTRQLGIVSVALLCFLYPAFIVVTLLLAGVALIFNRYH